MSMTEDELKAIEARVRAWRSRTGLGLCDVQQRDVLVLIAEVRRLRQVEASRDVAAYAFQPGTRTLSDGTVITDEVHPFAPPFQVVDDHVGDPCPQCGAKIEGRRT